MGTTPKLKKFLLCLVGGGILGTLSVTVLAAIDSDLLTPPMEVLVDEWARNNQLPRSATLQFRGEVILANQELAIRFQQDMIITPQGVVRADCRINDASVSFLRQGTRSVVFQGRQVQGVRDDRNRLRFFSLAFPRNKNEVFDLLDTLSLASKEELDLLKAFQVNTPASFALRKRITETIYGAGTIGDVAYVFPSHDNRAFLLHKASLFPVGLNATSDLQKPTGMGFEVTDLQIVELPPRKIVLPRNVIFHRDQTHVRLELTASNVETAKVDGVPLSVDAVTKGSTSLSESSWTTAVRALADVMNISY